MNTAVLILGNLHGTLVLVVLLSYGLSFIPAVLWKSSRNRNTFYEGLQEAKRVYSEYRDAKVDFGQEVSVIRNLAKSHKNGFNAEFFDVVESEIPAEDLDGMKIFTSKQSML